MSRVLTFVLCLMAGAVHAGAPDQDARRLFEEGRAAFMAGRFVESALHFEAAADRRPHAASHLMAARSWESADRPDHAADAYARALEAGGLADDARREAEQRLTSLERALGIAQVTSTDARGEPLRVQLNDGREVPTPARLHGPPGTHTLTIRMPSGDVTHRAVTLQAGQTADVRLGDVAANAPPPDVQLSTAMTTVTASPLQNRTRVWIAAGALAAGALAGGTAGWLWREANQTHEGYVSSPTRAELDRGRSLQTWTNVTLVGAAVLGAAGLTILLWPTEGAAEPRATLTLGPGAVAVGGRF